MEVDVDLLDLYRAGAVRRRGVSGGIIAIKSGWHRQLIRSTHCNRSRF
jgi:hypothetical protein